MWWPGFYFAFLVNSENFSFWMYSDAKTSRLTDVLQQFRDGVYPQYNPEKVSVYPMENCFDLRLNNKHLNPHK